MSQKTQYKNIELQKTYEIEAAVKTQIEDLTNKYNFLIGGNYIL